MKEYYLRSGLGDYPLYEPQGRPWTPLARPLAQSRIALICSAGISRLDQPRFRRLGADDFSVREIQRDTPPSDLAIHYDYFDHTDADADVNCIFPLQRLSELEGEGFIGGFCATAYGLGLGRWRQPTTPERLQNEAAEDLLARCRVQGADAALLVPT
jgi:D-proline reductase (dithiol) PrdB